MDWFHKKFGQNRGKVIGFCSKQTILLVGTRTNVQNFIKIKQRL